MGLHHVGGYLILNAEQLQYRNLMLAAALIDAGAIAKPLSR